ncbi:ATP-binding cassette domain-containing protein [Bifidobacterium sp.]|uniref:ATP-binding cassette domain-containing protein n=1 Tax=Bifidobacterium sp. TaxID=41200 RepID=UPI0039ED2FA3
MKSEEVEDDNGSLNDSLDEKSTDINDTDISDSNISDSEKLADDSVGEPVQSDDGEESDDSSAADDGEENDEEVNFSIVFEDDEEDEDADKDADERSQDADGTSAEQSESGSENDSVSISAASKSLNSQTVSETPEEAEKPASDRNGHTVAESSSAPLSTQENRFKAQTQAQAHTQTHTEPKPSRSRDLSEDSLHVVSQKINRRIRHLRRTRFEQYPILAFNKVTYTLRHERFDLLNKVDWAFYNSRVQSVLIRSDDERRAVVALGSGMRTPNHGTITFHGKDIQEMEPNEFRRHNIGVLFEHFNLRSELTASENIVLTMDVSGRNFLKPMPVLAAELLNQVQFPDDQFDTPVGQLSLLNQRKAQLARALSCDASIILADEPTLGLDDEDTETILDVMRFLADKKSKCMIIVTADEDLAAQTDAIIYTDD